MSMVAVAGVMASSWCGVVVPLVVVALAVQDSRRAASAELDASSGGPVVVFCYSSGSKHSSGVHSSLLL